MTAKQTREEKKTFKKDIATYKKMHATSIKLYIQIRESTLKTIFYSGLYILKFSQGYKLCYKKCSMLK